MPQECLGYQHDAPGTESRTSKPAEENGGKPLRDGGTVAQGEDGNRARRSADDQDGLNPITVDQHPAEEHHWNQGEVIQ